MDEVRRAEVRRLRGDMRAVIKGTTENPWALTPAEQRRLSTVVQHNRRLLRAYLLKEEFQAFWRYVRTDWAQKHLSHWLWWASHSRLSAFQKLTNSVLSCRYQHEPLGEEPQKECRTQDKPTCSPSHTPSPFFMRRRVHRSQNASIGCAQTRVSGM